MGLQRKMKRASGLFAAAALGTAMLAVVGPNARADDTTSARGQETSALLNTPLKVELNDTALPIAIKLIKKQTGLNIVFVGSADEFKKVSVSLNGKTVVEALNLIAIAAGADIWEKDGVYFVGPKGSAPKPAPEASPTRLLDEAPRQSAQVFWEKIYLMHTEPQALLGRIGIITGPLADLNQQMIMNAVHGMLESSKFKGDTPTAVPAFLPNISYDGQPRSSAAPSAPTGAIPTLSPAASLESLGNTSGQLSGGTSTTGDQNARRDNGGSRDEFGRGQGFGGGFPGGGGFQGGGTGRIGGAGGAGQPGGAGGAGGQAQGQARNLLPDGITDIFGYEADNSIIVRGTPDAIRDLKEVIGFFDVPPMQVMVKADFITVSQNDANSFGINWSFQKVNLQAGVNTGFTSSNTAYLTFATGNLQTQLSWILTTNHGKLVSAPIVTTFNNLPVTLFVGQQYPVFLSSPVVSQNGTVVLASNLVLFNISTYIQITPRINADHSITLTGQLNVSGINGTITGPQGQTAPIVSNQTVQVQRRIRNGETMVIGGLVSKNDTVASNKVPLLSDLPLIGNLFKSRNVATADSELLVFITPSIIPERSDTGTLRGSSNGLLNSGGASAGPGATGGGAAP